MYLLVDGSAKRQGRLVISQSVRMNGVSYAISENSNVQNVRQFGIRLEQRELIGVLNTIPLNSLRFVVEETICTKCSDEVHQEIVSVLS